jgi:hypothetical protein
MNAIFTKALMQTMMGLYDIGYGPIHQTRRQEPRPCLRCGKMHDHNNSFCSAECCKAWKNEKRGEPS